MCHGIKWAFAMESEKFSGSVSAPLVEDKSGLKIIGAVNAELKPAKDEWKAKLAFGVKTPNFNGARGWINVSEIFLKQFEQLCFYKIG